MSESFEKKALEALEGALKLTRELQEKNEALLVRHGETLDQMRELQEKYISLLTRHDAALDLIDAIEQERKRQDETVAAVPQHHPLPDMGGPVTERPRACMDPALVKPFEVCEIEVVQDMRWSHVAEDGTPMVVPGPLPTLAYLRSPNGNVVVIPAKALSADWLCEFGPTTRPEDLQRPKSAPSDGNT